MAELTKLSPAEEKKFQEWINTNPRVLQWKQEFVKQFNEQPDINTSDYDYRAAWKAGVVPEPDEYDENRLHWSSSTSSGKMLKSKEHKTAWKEFFMREFGDNPDKLRDDMVKQQGITKEQAEMILEKRLTKRPLMKDQKMENK